MRVKELIELLQQEDPERLVIVSKDGEGNGFSPMIQEFSVGFYEADSTWSGEFRTGEPDPEDEDEEKELVRSYFARLILKLLPTPLSNYPTGLGGNDAFTTL
jgi:hypothetical protein